MSKPKLTYFDLPGSRGEECRLALAVAGVDFEDIRIPFAEWPALKPKMPFGAMPVLEMPGHPPIAHSNAILRLLGHLHDMHPSEPYEAARHEGMMIFVEEVRHHVGPKLRIADDTKVAVREEIAKTWLPAWAKFAESQLGDGPFFAGAKLHVVDLKLHMIVRWFRTGGVDHIPGSIFDAFPKLVRLHDAVGAHPAIQAWRAKH